MPVLSEYVREIVYNLTRKNAPNIKMATKRNEKMGATPPIKSITQKMVSFVFSSSRDPNRITFAQEQELARLRREKSHS